MSSPAPEIRGRLNPLVKLVEEHAHNDSYASSTRFNKKNAKDLLNLYKNKNTEYLSYFSLCMVAEISADSHDLTDREIQRVKHYALKDIEYFIENFIRPFTHPSCSMLADAEHAKKIFDILKKLPSKYLDRIVAFTPTFIKKEVMTTLNLCLALRMKTHDYLELRNKSEIAILRSKLCYRREMSLAHTESSLRDRERERTDYKPR